MEHKIYQKHQKAKTDTARFLVVAGPRLHHSGCEKTTTEVLKRVFLTTGGSLLKFLVIHYIYR